MTSDDAPSRAQLREHVRVAGKTYRNVLACVRSPDNSTALAPGAPQRNVPRQRIMKLVAVLPSPVCVRTLAYGSKTLRTSNGQEASVQCARAALLRRAFTHTHRFSCRHCRGRPPSTSCGGCTALTWSKRQRTASVRTARHAAVWPQLTNSGALVQGGTRSFTWRRRSPRIRLTCAPALTT